MDKEEIRRLSISYLNGESDKETEKKLLKHLSEDKANMLIFKRLEDEWKRTRGSRADVGMLVGIEDRIAARKRKVTASWALGSAIAVVALGIVSVLTMNHGQKPVQVAESKSTIIETGPCDRTRVTLPDGTSVCLNSCSRLEYDSDFNNEARRLSLAGEALFDVVKDESRPFVVNLGEEEIVVKGTKFNVSAYSKTKAVTVALIEGKIEFNEGETVLSVNPGEVVFYDRNSCNLIKRTDDVCMYSIWTDGRIEYSSVTLPDLLERLSCIYNLEIRYTPVKYTDKTFSISLSTEESIRNILDAVSIIIPIKWTKDGNVIIINEV